MESLKVGDTVVLNSERHLCKTLDATVMTVSSIQQDRIYVTYFNKTCNLCVDAINVNMITRVSFQ